jgi:hypothetical protein
VYKECLSCGSFVRLESFNIDVSLPTKVILVSFHTKYIHAQEFRRQPTKSPCEDGNPPTMAAKSVGEMSGGATLPRMPAVVRSESGNTTNSSFAPGEQFCWLDGDARGEHREDC